MQQKIISNIAQGDRLAIARVMSQIENKTSGYAEILSKLHQRTGNAFRIGITGPPGSGKSTLTNFLAKILRKNNQQVGIIAVDPTSPFTGGAILGDRIRMTDLSLDRGVFIRSMATRGSSGGLAAQATELADVLDAAGFDYIIFETVGVGQVELDIARAADSTLVMVVPEGGDIIQNLKSGLMEIADIFVVNKADRSGADRMQKDIEYVLHLREPVPAWQPQVFQTVANRGEGISELWTAIKKHRAFLESGDALSEKRRRHLRHRVKTIVREHFETLFWDEQRQKDLENYLENEQDSVSPYDLAGKLVSQLVK